VLGLVGRLSIKRPIWDRHYVIASDGSTVAYEVAEPVNTSLKGDITLVLVPGFSNHSDTNYIRYLTITAQQSGYRCVVFNHVGLAPGVPITGPRIFSTGYTEDLALVIDEVVSAHPHTKILLVGFSMGANIIVKYLGERRTRPLAVVGGISVSQGYTVLERSIRIPIIRGVQKFYFLFIAILMKRYILMNKDVLLTDKLKDKFDLDEDKIVRARNIMEVDENYTRRIYGYSNILEFYEDNSSSSRLETVEVPLVLINARDDPFVPYNRVKAAREIVDRHEKAVLVELKHGGHIAFYEGGVMIPNRTPWIDTAILEMADVIFRNQENRHQ
jgi:abhydrolase domain-containing protein 2